MNSKSFLFFGHAAAPIISFILFLYIKLMFGEWFSPFPTPSIPHFLFIFRICLVLLTFEPNERTVICVRSADIAKVSGLPVIYSTGYLCVYVLYMWLSHITIIFFTLSTAQHTHTRRHIVFNPCVHNSIRNAVMCGLSVAAAPQHPVWWPALASTIFKFISADDGVLHFCITQKPLNEIVCYYYMGMGIWYTMILVGLRRHSYIHTVHITQYEHSLWSFHFTNPHGIRSTPFISSANYLHLLQKTNVYLATVDSAQNQTDTSTMLQITNSFLISVFGHNRFAMHLLYRHFHWYIRFGIAGITGIQEKCTFFCTLFTHQV